MSRDHNKAEAMEFPLSYSNKRVYQDSSDNGLIEAEHAPAQVSHLQRWDRPRRRETQW